jgi:phosphatidylserine/phosphatidylglycerophosphate/cardiolipin synthase-like enzyme
MTPDPPYPRRPYAGLALLSLLFCLTTVSLALAWPAASPAFYFTDNIASSGPGDGVTLMEQALLARIAGADGQIDLAIYDFNRSSIRDALLDAHDRGVAVRVVTDDDARRHPVYQLYYDALADAGIPVVDDQRPGSLMHNKFFIFDNEVVWTGSSNITANDFTVNHNNSIVLTSTLLAEIYGREFQQMFDGSFSNAKSASLTTTLDYHGRPLQIYFSPKDQALEAIIQEVAAAEESIHFSIFFFTSPALAQVLIERRQAGLAIWGVWDLLGAASSFSQDEALCAAGIPIKIEDFYGKMHNKFMVIDAQGAAPRIVTGSMNWSGAGNNSNDENSLILHDGLTVAAYYDTFWELYETLDEDTLCDVTVIAPAYVWLPFVARPVATPPPIVGDNVVCQTTGDSELCAWVANGAPPRYASVTVYGRLRTNGVGQEDLTMVTSWHFRTTTSHCEGVTQGDGVAACSRNIGGASAGYQVDIAVALGDYTVTTWFTPQP